MINKTIHFVWMGRGEKSDLIKKCIESWRKYLHDFEIVEWNEDNFNLGLNQYVKEAYESKKWAFVSDYVRLYALEKYGGIYLDTDMEVLKPIDELLKHSAFSGFESKDHIPTGIMGAQKNHPWITELISYYNERSFYKADGSFDMTPNVVNITQKTVNKFGLVINNSYQELDNNLVIYPKEYFCPSDYGDSLKEKKKKITDKSYTIHHYNGSWLTPWGKFKVKLKRTYLGRIIKKVLFGK